MGSPATQYQRALQLKNIVPGLPSHRYEKYMDVPKTNAELYPPNNGCACPATYPFSKCNPTIWHASTGSKDLLNAAGWMVRHYWSPSNLKIFVDRKPIPPVNPNHRGDLVNRLAAT